MSYQVLVSDNAKNDLEGIADYICNSLYAPVAAQKILKKLQDSILGLSDFPERYPIYAEEPWQSRGVRNNAMTRAWRRLFNKFLKFRHFFITQFIQKICSETSPGKQHPAQNEQPSIFQHNHPSL